MYKRVDGIEEDEIIEGFTYENKLSSIETVLMESNFFVQLIESEGDGMSQVYYEDIPNLIKALQAVYDHWKENK